MNSLVTRIGLVVMMCAAANTARAWNGYGHMSVAYVAYQKLTPAARNKADALLRTNPDYNNWLKMMPAGSSQSEKNLMAFMIAATWPDRIKSAPGYHEDNPANREICGPTSTQNIGFTDTFRHRCWHYVDTAFSQDNSPLMPAPDPNAKERLGVFRPALHGTDENQKAYDLSWTLHLVGDLHQPLHCTTRVRHGELTGDNGGNRTLLKGGKKPKPLHGYWDDLLGTSSSVTRVIKSAKKLPSADAMQALDLNVDHWVDEGVQLAKTKVYVSPIGKDAGPFKLSKKYKTNAKTLAQKQVALAGERLAHLLNAELK